MTTIYTTDAHGVYIGNVDVDPYTPLPSGSTLTPPPEVTSPEVAQCIGGEWVVLPSYPVPEPAPTPVPQTLPMRQAKLVLLAAGLLDDVDAAVAGADRATQIEWEYAQEVSRTWPSLVAMATALGMTDAQLDDLFIQGAKL